MSDERFQRLCDIFEHARKLPPENREAFLREGCGADTALRDEVEALLHHHDQEEPLLNQPITPLDMLSLESESPLPERIGSYSILRKLGQGGMGVVYLAKQHNPDREVAIKVMRAGLLSREMEKRFELETAVLGRLQHPGVAQIYEAGLHEVGGNQQPYFAMEYVKGKPLDKYAEENNPKIRERLQLFIQICAAVHHAHQKGIIHRDLKPNNILVVASDKSPSTTKSKSGDSRSSGERLSAVKILDFGVARSTDVDLQMTSLQTDVGQLVGTLPYMSPEQVSGHAHDVDTRSDVYALGVLFYELLSGKLPYEVNAQTFVKAARMILEQEPTPLSTINNAYRGDLNTIALKALEKQPDRRYASASDLAMDIERYLNSEPIVARRASAIYQLRKFAARNKGLVSGLLAALAILIAGVVTSSMFAIGQTKALRESEQQRQMSNAVVTFLTNDLLAKANPYASGKHEYTVREALDNAAEQVHERFKNQPELEATIRSTLGAAYQGLGNYDEAAIQFERSLDLYDPVIPPDDERRFAIRFGILANYVEKWKLDEALPIAQESIALAEEHLGQQHPRTAQLYSRYAVLLKRLGRNDEAEQSFRKAIDIYQQFGEDHEQSWLTASNNLALLLRDLNRSDEAVKILAAVVNKSTELYGAASLITARHKSSLGDVLWSQVEFQQFDDVARNQKLQESERLYRETLEVRQRLLGESHVDTGHSYNSMGHIAYSRGEFADAEKWSRKALATLLDAFGTDENLFVLNAKIGVATALREQQKYEEAAKICREATEVAERLFGQQHSSAVYYRHSLYSILWGMADVEAIESLRAKYNETALDRARGWYALAQAYARKDDFAMACETLRKAIDALPDDSPTRTQWQSTLIQWMEQREVGNESPSVTSAGRVCDV